MFVLIVSALCVASHAKDACAAPYDGCGDGDGDDLGGHGDGDGDGDGDGNGDGNDFARRIGGKSGWTQ